MKTEFDAKRFLVVVVTVAYIGMVYLLFFVPIIEANKEVLIAQVAVLSAGVGAMFGYHFGSSSGSAKKTEMLAQPTTSTTTTTPNAEIKTVTEPKKEGE